MRFPRVPAVPALAAALALAAPTAVAAPLGNYYLTDPLAGNIDVIGAGGLRHNPMAGSPDQAVIAVLGATVRTLGSQNGDEGAEYALGAVLELTPTGAGYPNSTTAVFLDGTGDGQWNYAVDYLSGDVYRFDSAWSFDAVLFSQNEAGWQGITWERFGSGVWLSNFLTGEIIRVALDGTLLGGFDTQRALTLTALAMDLDGSLWLVANDGGGPSTLEHYATDGTYLGGEALAGLGAPLGGEIGAVPSAGTVPEPATLGLLVLGFAGLRAFRRA